MRSCDRRRMGLQAQTTTRRTIALLASAVLILVGLTSCTPETKGITGLTVDVDGRPLAVLAWCADRPPDVVRLFPVNDSTSPTPSGRATLPPNWQTWPGREYTVPATATSPTTVPLEGFRQSRLLTRTPRSRCTEVRRTTASPRIECPSASAS